jgi:phospholipid/cholesterol/gamma-HCH transport system substrate-binding protein
LVKFRIPKSIRLGERTEAAVKLKTILGAKAVEITPRGEGKLEGPIPLERTTPAYQVPDALGDLSATVAKLNTNQLSNALSVLGSEFRGTPPQVKAAVEGVGRLAKTLDERDTELRNLLVNADAVTGVLAERADAIARLVVNTDKLLAALASERYGVDNIFVSLRNVINQIDILIDNTGTTLPPTLDKLNGTLEIVDRRKERLILAVKNLNSIVVQLGEAVSSGPIFKANLVNLAPGQYVQPFIDSAFSDLGIDPATLLPSQLTDPQYGAPGTPPLPVPYPRTGQGGAPRTTIPDAITGNAEDPGCPGLPAPSRPGAPGCYPLKEEPPAPPPGGPPPGPPVPGPGGPRRPPIGPYYNEPAPGQTPQGPLRAPEESFGPRPGPPQPAEGGQQ